MHREEHASEQRSIASVTGRCYRLAFKREVIASEGEFTSLQRSDAAFVSEERWY